MKVLMAFLIGTFVLAAHPGLSEKVRRRPLLLLVVAAVVTASYLSLRVVSG